MSAEANRTLARRVYDEAMIQRNLAVLDELYSPDFVYHAPTQTLQGADALKQALALYFAAFPGYPSYH